MTRWMLNEGGGIRWKVADDSRIPHTDRVEMSGLYVSFIPEYEVGWDRTCKVKRTVIFPMLRTLPNDTHASLRREYDEMVAPTIKVNGQAIDRPVVQEVVVDGLLTIQGESPSGVAVERVLFATVRHTAACERWTIRNLTAQGIRVDVSGATLLSELSDESRGVYGSYRMEVTLVGAPVAHRLAPGASLSFGVVLAARIEGEPALTLDVSEEEEERRAWIGERRKNLRLETPELLLNAMFDMTKTRTSETLFQTRGGLVHSPGGFAFYAAVWCNDEAEYAGPFFPFLGYDKGNEASLNAYRWIARYMNETYDRLPSSVIAEGTDTWNWKSTSPGDRGDAAMCAYGASRFVMTLGDETIARELWPFIQWCLEYCRRRLTPAGIVASESDELEHRFSTGDANLCTSCLTYDALRSAALLAPTMGEGNSLAAEYGRQADGLRAAIEREFGANVQGFETYRYHDGNTILRSWIAMPLISGIFDRADGTVDALFSTAMWDDKKGVATEVGATRFAWWDRSTLYALRGAFAAGATDRALDHWRRFAENRFVGEHAPYPVEVSPMGTQLSAESALYCRVAIEGLFGVRPTGFRSFTCAPRLPFGWNRMALRDIKAFDRTFDIEVERVAGGQRVRVTVAGRPVLDQTWDGTGDLSVQLA